MSTHPVGPRDLYSMRYFYANVSGAYYAARHFEDAIRYSQRALDVPLPATRTNAMRGGALGNMGAARWQSGDLDGALKTILESVELQKADAADGQPALRINLANGLLLEGMILGRQDAEPSLGRSREALANFRDALDIAEDLSKKDPLDYLGRHNVAVFALEVGNILRHSDPRQALSVYDHALARIREAKSNASTQRDEAELLAGSSYPLRWLGRKEEARQRIARALELLSQAGRYPADRIEPMSDAYDVLRAQSDDYAETRQTVKAVETYQQLLDKLMAWNPDPQNDLRDAACLSRTWTALADLLRRTGRTEQANRLVAQRTDLWNQWNNKLPNAQFLLRQSLSQITPHASLSSPSKH
jgi:tetratricopeptide (TPR) repeat protein